MVHGFHFDFTRHNIPIDLEVRGFEVRGLSKVHLAAVLKALLYCTTVLILLIILTSMPGNEITHIKKPS